MNWTFRSYFNCSIPFLLISNNEIFFFCTKAEAKLNETSIRARLETHLKSIPSQSQFHYRINLAELNRSMHFHFTQFHPRSSFFCSSHFPLHKRNFLNEKKNVCSSPECVHMHVGQHILGFQLQWIWEIDFNISFRHHIWEHHSRCTCIFCWIEWIFLIPSFSFLIVLTQRFRLSASSNCIEF